MQNLISHVAIALAEQVELYLSSQEATGHDTYCQNQNSQIKICPIPARSEHLLKRGFSPQHLLADQLAYCLGPRFTYDARSLMRIKPTPCQTGSSRKDRLKQQNNAFLYQGQTGERVLIVDDVLTTGATLKEAHRAVAKAKAMPLLSCLMFVTQD